MLFSPAFPTILSPRVFQVRSITFVRFPLKGGIAKNESSIQDFVAVFGEIVRNSKRQFVLLFGTLLSFGNGGSLFAGMICQPDLSQTQDIFPEGIGVRDSVRPPVEDNHSEAKASAFVKVTPNERGETTTAPNESLQLLGKSFTGALEKPPASRRGIQRAGRRRPLAAGAPTKQT
jgi:hypothetical protein